MQTASGQRIKPTGIFLSDSVEVGKPVYFSLIARHKPEVEVFFPDSSYNFSPFEIISLKSFVSVTDDRGTLDSAVYQLVSFDVSKVQALKMPVYIFQKKDCTAVFTAADSVFLIKSNILGSKEKPILQAETGLSPLSRQFNFSILIGSIALIIGVVGSIYWVFGQDIYKQWQLVKLQRRHLEYFAIIQQTNAQCKGEEQYQGCRKMQLLFGKTIWNDWKKSHLQLTLHA
jgi:hypothetical protein